MACYTVEPTINVLEKLFYFLIIAFIILIGCMSTAMCQEVIIDGKPQRQVTVTGVPPATSTFWKNPDLNQIVTYTYNDTTVQLRLGSIAADHDHVMLLAKEIADLKQQLIDEKIKGAKDAPLSIIDIGEIPLYPRTEYHLPLMDRHLWTTTLTMTYPLSSLPLLRLSP